MILRWTQHHANQRPYEMILALIFWYGLSFIQVPCMCFLFQHYANKSASGVKTLQVRYSALHKKLESCDVQVLAQNNKITIYSCNMMWLLNCCYVVIDLLQSVLNTLFCSAYSLLSVCLECKNYMICTLYHTKSMMLNSLPLYFSYWLNSTLIAHHLV